MVYRLQHKGKYETKGKHEAFCAPHTVLRMTLAAAVVVMLAVPGVSAPILSYADETQGASGVQVITEAESSDQGAAANGGSGEASALADVVGSAEKQEVVYATLATNGSPQNVYVVNVIDGQAGQRVEDFGEYSSVVNLTDTSQIAQTSDSVIFTMPEGGFTYQGNAPKATIPWNISIDYKLDGANINPEDLAGKSGSFELDITTSENTAVDPSYYENYLMQITCTLPLDVAQNVATDQGSIALSGSDTTVSFMVMPGSDGSVSLTADVQNFEMEGMSFAAIPFSMTLDLPDTDSIVSQFDALVDGANELNSGTQQFADGVTGVNNATKQVALGAAEISSGITQTVQGLQQYQQGLLQSASESSAAADASTEAIDQATTNYENAFGAYVGAIAAAYHQIASSYPSADPSTVLQMAIELVNDNEQTSEIANNYQDALSGLTEAAGTKAGYQASAEALKQAANNLGSADNAQSILGGMVALQGGVASLTDGTSQLAGGTQELATGAQELREGTNTFARETQGIPDAVKAEIDNLMSDYDKSDFVPTSFTSSKNSNVKLVQFVLSTEPIKANEPEQTEEPEQEQTLLDRFFALFS